LVVTSGTSITYKHRYVYMYSIFALDHDDIGEIVSDRAVYVLPDPVYLTFKKPGMLF